MQERQSVERLRPNSREAEFACLGSIARNPDAMADIAEVVREEDFYAFGHQKIFAAALELWHAKKPTDVVHLADQLHKNSHLEDAGGYGYLVELHDAAPNASRGVNYARIVAEKAKLRRLIDVAHDIQEKAFEQSEPASEILEMAEKAIYAVNHEAEEAKATSFLDGVSDALRRADRRQETGGEVLGMSTGYRALDELTNGFHEGDLIIVAARTSVGKTAFLSNLVRNFVIAGEPGLFFSLEQSREEVFDALICMDGMVHSGKSKRGQLNEGERTRFIDSAERLSFAKAFIDDRSTVSLSQIFAAARRAKLKTGLRWLAIDYLQLIKPAAMKESREQQVARISREAKLMAKELKVPLIMLAQLNRDAEMTRPTLRDLRESGAIEQDADLVILLHDPQRGEKFEGPRPDNTIDVMVAKQRKGPVGDIGLLFQRAFLRMRGAEDVS